MKITVLIDGNGLWGCCWPAIYGGPLSPSMFPLFLPSIWATSTRALTQKSSQLQLHSHNNSVRTRHWSAGNRQIKMLLPRIPLRPHRGLRSHHDPHRLRQFFRGRPGPASTRARYPSWPDNFKVRWSCSNGCGFKARPPVRGYNRGNWNRVDLDAGLMCWFLIMLRAVKGMYFLLFSHFRPSHISFLSISQWPG